MSWWLVAWLSLGAYAFKVLGFVVVGGRRLPEPVTRCLLLIPAALLAALVVKDAATTGQQLVLDERMVGLGVAAVAAWRRLPLIAVVVLAAGATAALRAAAG
ncbi:MAG: AzlD domain-containing protein [Actinobacteria bacterium]|nr:AzlD domain-containing protein [Actinomycetota bacterium]